MRSSFLGNLFWFLALACLFVLLNSRDHEGNDVSLEQKATEASIEKVTKSSQIKFPKFAEAYQKVFRTQDPEEKLSAIEVALTTADFEGFADEQVLAQLHQIAAKVHESRWHIPYAIESLQKSQSLKFSSKVDRYIKQLKSALARMEAERELNQEYIATRFSGPAKTLQGKVLFAYIFIDDGIKTRWTDRYIQRSNQVLSQVQDWQIDQANRYQVNDITFVNKQFMIQRDPRLKMLSAMSHKSSRQNIEDFVEIVMDHLGAKDVGDFISTQMEKEGADQGVIIFHSNFERRSFARRCGYTHQRIYYRAGKRHVENISRCSDEYVMLMEQVKRNRWDKLHYVQAHESLHLFGADDLYSISGAKNYALTDIMNYQSKYLKDSQISPITAYAIGWQEMPTDAPFKIIER